MEHKKNIILSAIIISSIIIFGIKTFSKIKNTEYINAEKNKYLTADIYKKAIESPAEVLPEKPAAPADAKPQKTDKAINSVAAEQKIVALTFDADMTPRMEYDLKNGNIKSWYNEAVIEELKKNQAPATLFLTGLWIKNYPDQTRELAKNPLFEIANHSYSHSGFTLSCFKLPAIADNLDEEEIIQAEELLKQYAPNYKKYFRFPGLCYDDFDAIEAQKLGYKIIHGNIRGGDGFNYDTNSIISRVVSRLSPGGIIILHMHGPPNAPRTAEALPEIIRQTREKGYRFVKISELLNSSEQ